jgi:curved DNA-binding protein CbpA
MSRSALVDLEPLVLLMDRVFADLDVLSGYNLLGVAPDASEEEIRQAFHSRALLLHPDRFYSLPDRGLRDRIGAVYKRVAEAYRVLSQPQARAGYDLLLARGQVRCDQAAATQAYEEAQEAQAFGGGPESGIGRSADPASPQARQFYNLGRSEMQRQDFRSAVGYLEQALSMEPASARIRAALEQARRLLELYGG